MNGEVTMTIDELIKEARKLMILSSYKAKARTEQRKDYISKGIKYELDIGSKLVEQIQMELPDKWEQWLQQTHAYLCAGKAKMKRPTIDRRDSSGDYCLENIDFLPLDEHLMKDRAIGVTVYDFHRQTLNQYVTMTEASEALMCSVETVSRYTGSDIRYKDRYLIQSEGKKAGKCNRKAERMQKVLAVSTVIIEEFDDEGNFVREFPIQIKNEITFPAIQARRHAV